MMPRKIWTPSTIRRDAQRFDTKMAWRKSSSGAEGAARMLGKAFLDGVCAHMIILRKHWTVKELRSSAAQFNSKPEWKSGDRAAYVAAYQKGKAFVDYVCKHMPEKAHVVYNTEEAIAAKAKEYPSRMAWLRGHKHSYELSCALGKKKHDANCAHMRKYVPPKSKFTKAVCRKSAKKYSTRYAWAKEAPGAYQAATKRYGKAFLDSCCRHMTPPKVWTKDQILKTARKFKRISDWRDACPGQYLSARRHGWSKAATAHMLATDKGVPNIDRYLYRIDGMVAAEEGMVRYIYVGLTAHRQKRMSVHSCVSSDKSWLMALPTTKIVWSGPFDPLTAARKEQAAIKYWKDKERKTGQVNVLNRNAGGGLGGYGRAALLRALPPLSPARLS